MLTWPPNGSFEIKVTMPEPAWRNDFDKKRQFGELLKEGLKPFEAAIKLFVNDTGAALWVSQNWLNDEIVKNVVGEKNLKLLDKEQLAAKVLAFADEKDLSGRFYVNEAEYRLKALELYAKICGYTKENPTAQFVNDNRTMNIRLVSPEKKQDKVVTVDAEEIEVEKLQLPVKLVN